MTGAVTTRPGAAGRLLGAIERIGNRLPDPALLFVALLLIVWVLSWLLSGVSFEAVDPRTGAPVQVKNLLAGGELTQFFADMVRTFVGFHPVGVVLVAMLGIGVAEHTGFIHAALRALLAVTARTWLTPMVIFVGIILLTAFLNPFVGSASAKWALLAPIFVPMLMQLGIAPDLTQAAYRIGDSSTNIITPLMPYFPLVVVFCQRYVKNTGIGTVTAMMLPYALVFLIVWSAFLLLYWGLGLPLGLQSAYTYSPDPA